MSTFSHQSFLFLTVFSLRETEIEARKGHYMFMGSVRFTSIAARHFLASSSFSIQNRSRWKEEEDAREGRNFCRKEGASERSIAYVGRCQCCWPLSTRERCDKTFRRFCLFQKMFFLFQAPTDMDG